MIILSIKLIRIINSVFYRQIVHLRDNIVVLDDDHSRNSTELSKEITIAAQPHVPMKL